MDPAAVMTVVQATSAAVDLFDKIASQIKAFVHKQPEKVVAEGEERWRHKIKQEGKDLVVRVQGRAVQTITAEELQVLPQGHLTLIQTYEESMQRNYRLWQAVYKKRDASPDALVNAQTDEQLTDLIRKMKRDLNGILEFLQSIGLDLDDHYMEIRHLVNNV
jgi:hypothetical protein